MARHSSPTTFANSRNMASPPFSRCSFDMAVDSANDKRSLADLVAPTCVSLSSKAVARAAQAVWTLRPDSARGGRPARNCGSYLIGNRLMDLLLDDHALCFVEVFGERPVHRRRQFARLLHLALVAPAACKAHGGSALPQRRYAATLFRYPQAHEDDASDTERAVDQRLKEVDLV